MADHHQVQRIAADHVQWRGREALAWLRERAEIAEQTGDHEAAKAWREIADAAERLLQSR